MVMRARLMVLVLASGLVGGLVAAGPASASVPLEVDFDYSMPDRLSPGTTLQEVVPATWHVDFDACQTERAGPGLQGTEAEIGWEIQPADIELSFAAPSVGLGIPGSGGPRPLAVTMQQQEGGDCDDYYAEFPREGVYEVTLNVSHQGRSGSASKAVVVQDWLVVSIGDSYASGEGNPHTAVDITVFEKLGEVGKALIHLAPCSDLHAEDTLWDSFWACLEELAAPLFRDNPLFQGLGVDSGLADDLRKVDHYCFHADNWQESVKCPFKIGELGLDLVGVGGLYDYFAGKWAGVFDSLGELFSSLLHDGLVNGAKWAPQGVAGQRSNGQCHRSDYAGPAQAARWLEVIDPRTSVTFIHLACSGATIDAGVLGNYRGPLDGHDHDYNTLPPQLQQVAELVGDREIDALLVSIGGNDLGFGSIVKAFMVQEPANPLYVDWDGETPVYNPGIEASLESICRLDLMQNLNDVISGLGLGFLLDWIPDEVKNWCTNLLFSFLQHNSGHFVGHRTAEEILQGGLGGSLIDLPPRYTELGPIAQPSLALGGLAQAYGRLGAALTLPRSEGGLGIPQDQVGRVYVTEYPNVLSGPTGPCDLGWFDILDRMVLPGASQVESAWAGAVVLPALNGTLQEAAAAQGWHYIGGITSGFEGHGICAGRARYFNTLWDSFVNQWEAEGTAHPNRAGHQVYAEQIIKALAADLYPGLPTQALPTAGMGIDWIRELWTSSDGPLAFPTRIGRIPGGVTPGSQPPSSGETTGDEEPASSVPGGVSTTGGQSDAEGSPTAGPAPSHYTDTTSPVAAPAATSDGSGRLLLLAVISAALGATLIAWAIHRRISLIPAPPASRGFPRPADAAGSRSRPMFAPCRGCGRPVNQELESCPYCHSDPSTGM